MHHIFKNNMITPEGEGDVVYSLIWPYEEIHKYDLMSICRNNLINMTSIMIFLSKLKLQTSFLKLLIYLDCFCRPENPRIPIFKNYFDKPWFLLLLIILAVIYILTLYFFPFQFWLVIVVLQVFQLYIALLFMG